METLGSVTPLSRPTITGLKAHSLLANEFEQARPAPCRRCLAPATFWGPAPGNDVYWYLQAPDACLHGCDKILVELWAKITTEYRIAPPAKAPTFPIMGRRAAAAQE